MRPLNLKLMKNIKINLKTIRVGCILTELEKYEPYILKSLRI